MAVQEDPNWQPWLVSAQAGDTTSYAKLLHGITPLLRNFVAKRLFDQDLVEDTVQEILLGLHKMRATYNPQQPFIPWLLAIARYKIIDAIRRHSKKNQHQVMSLDDEDAFFGETIGTDVTKPDAGDVRRDLQAALNQLPVRQQTIVSLLKIQGWSVAAIAHKLDMTPSAVKVMAHRAYKQLRKHLEA